MASIEKAADFFVLLGLRAEYGIGLIEENCGPTVFGRHLAKQVGRRHVYGLDRTRHQRLHYL